MWWDNRCVWVSGKVLLTWRQYGSDHFKIQSFIFELVRFNGKIKRIAVLVSVSWHQETTLRHITSPSFQRVISHVTVKPRSFQISGIPYIPSRQVKPRNILRNTQNWNLYRGHWCIEHEIASLLFITSLFVCLSVSTSQSHEMLSLMRYVLWCDTDWHRMSNEISFAQVTSPLLARAYVWTIAVILHIHLCGFRTIYFFLDLLVFFKWLALWFSNKLYF